MLPSLWSSEGEDAEVLRAQRLANSRHIHNDSSGDSEVPPGFFISVWLPQARREFFISMIILLLLKAGKSHPGTEAGSCL